MTDQREIPVYFKVTPPPASAACWEGKARLLSGFLHVPRGNAGGAREGRSAAILCNPFGSEQNCLYRCYRTLAERLALAGLSVLRFDYYGTGNSPGHDRETGLVRAWLDSIHAAVDFMAGEAGAENVYLFGTRLGATLATAVASEPGAGRIGGIALWNPFDTGGDFCREILFAQKLTARNGEPSVPASSAGPDREVSGFVLTAATIADLRRVDLLATAELPVSRALVLARRATLPEVRLVGHLRSRGVQTEHEFLPGITEAMGAPDQNVFPVDVVDRVTNWIVDSSRSQEAAGSNAADVTPRKFAAFDRRSPVSVDVDAVVRERALNFRGSESLFGIVSESRHRHPGNPPGIVLINPGAVHSTGANRLYVNIARAYAAAGFPVMRFDFSGIGDSPVTSDTEDLLTQLRPRVLQREHDGFIGQDIQAAMNTLGESCGVNRFVLLGMCSSGRMAFHSAIADQRVVGAVLVNTPYFDVGDSLEPQRIADASFSRYRQQFGRWGTWARVFRGDVDFARAFHVVRLRVSTDLAYWVRRFGTRGGTRRAGTTLAASEEPGPATPLSASLRETFEGFVTLARRGVSPLLLYSPNDVGLDYVQRDLGDTLRRLGIGVHILPGADHDMSRQDARAQLFDLLTAYLAKIDGREPGAGAEIPQDDRARPTGLSTPSRDLVQSTEDRG